MDGRQVQLLEQYREHLRSWGWEFLLEQEVSESGHQRLLPTLLRGVHIVWFLWSRKGNVEGGLFFVKWSCIVHLLTCAYSL